MIGGSLNGCTISEMDYGQSLRRRLADNEAVIATLKERLAGLELEQHKVAIALEVFSTLTSEQIAQGAIPRARAIEPSVPAMPVRGRGRVGVRELIVNTLSETGFPLTKMDVVTRLAAAGHTLNTTTVASTLSKLVDLAVLEKASHSKYRIKAAVESAESGSP